MGIAIIGTDERVTCTYLMTSDERMNGNVEESGGNGYIIRKVFKYSKDPVEEWKQVCKYVLEIFKRQTIDVLLMIMDSLVDQNVSIIDFFKANVKSVNECYPYQSKEENDVDEHAAYLLNNLTVNNELHSNLRIKNYHFDEKIFKNLKELNIYNSKWIGYNRLLEIDCRSVVLGKNLISIKEWNLFIKKWIAMKTNKNLEYLELDYRDFEEFRALVLHDIPHELVDGGIKRTINKLSYPNRSIEISGGIDIRRVDGKTATFFVFQMEFLAMSVN
ncbi:hypothetical protein CRE_09793 [Caenorhabditis remanei]|uniref:Sdz-33 F-box domain-containing protein n=1 Tax=Caenorhabditis remanei TaxID=31234 RepID=E3NDF7_CAERE|nr:hypothetical protein CRE_09793 [Caenorhabditis remanei]